MQKPYEVGTSRLGVVIPMVMNKLKHWRCFSGIGFQKLTPKDDMTLGIYQDALDFVFRHEDLKNVAITGTYSSGKSTILKSYEKELAGENFVYVSLARFERDYLNEEVNEPTTTNNGKEEINANISMQTLEGKVINQLIHSFQPNKAPKTRFRVKKGLSSFARMAIAAFIAFIVLLFLYIFRFDYWISFVQGLETNILDWLLNEWVRLIAGIMWVAMLYYLIYILISFLDCKQILTKISFKGGDIEIFPDIDDSNFDKYLDELLYIIQCSETDVFVFEDIDRFNTTDIFVKLREINQLVNRRLRCGERKTVKCFSWSKKPRVIRFFYLIRDDLFTSNDRTKFFDFIIPTVPVVVATNSYERLVEMLEPVNLKKNLMIIFKRDFLVY